MTDTSQALKSILAGAPQGAKTYALMDCALDSTIYPTIQGSGCPMKCLYAEAWQSGLADIAPYLVELAPNAPFYTTLLSWDWYANWGCFVQSNADLDRLVSHLQTLTTAQVPGGQHAFFRFYDPRVLRPFLAVAAPDDLKAVFDGVARFVVPMLDDGLKGEGAIVYALDNGALKPVETRFDD